LLGPRHPFRFFLGLGFLPYRRATNRQAFLHPSGGYRNSHRTTGDGREDGTGSGHGGAPGIVRPGMPSAKPRPMRTTRFEPKPLTVLPDFATSCRREARCSVGLSYTHNTNYHKLGLLSLAKLS
jgi:hypothetical protein